MTSTSPDLRAADAREAVRSSIYLAATLYCDASLFPVKIRNISTTGALVEGATVPSGGSLVQLVRGGLIVHGLIAWSGDGRCGIKFSGSIDVATWRATPSNSEQQRVDEVVRLVKAGAVPFPVPSAPQDTEMTGHVSQDLRRVSQLLESLGAVLCADLNVLAQHGVALQNLDIATQMIATIDGIVSGEIDVEIEPAKMPALRRSADQALQAGRLAKG